MPQAIIITALQVELEAVLRHLINRHRESREGQQYHCGEFAVNEGLWQVAAVEIGAGNDNAAFEAGRAIAFYKPDVALLVGVAGGLKDVDFGDVVAATVAHNYERGKAKDGFEARPEVGKSSYKMVNLAKALRVDSEWVDRIQGHTISTKPSVIVEPIAAGEKVVASQRSPIYKYLRQYYGHCVAVEMEGRGFLRATEASPEVLALIVRGISDLVKDKNQQADNYWQDVASRHAAAFAFEILANVDVDALSLQQDSQKNRKRSDLEQSAEGIALLQAMPMSDPALELYGFYYYPEDAFGEPKTGPFYPQSLREAIATTLAFTIASSSLGPIRIQNVFIRVLETDTFKQATFPAYDRGGNGITPVVGWVELKPAPGSYQVMSNVKWNVGKGLNPADFHIRTFCRNGSKFKLAIEVEWMNLEDQRQSHRHTFTKELTVGLPELMEWKGIVRKAKRVRALVSLQDASLLLKDFVEMGVKAELNILSPLAENGDPVDFAPVGKANLSDVWNKSVTAIPSDEMRLLTSLVGTYEGNNEEGNTRNFIVADESIAIIENENRNELAEVIEDKERLRTLIEAFDNAARRFASS